MIKLAENILNKIVPSKKAEAACWRPISDMTRCIVWVQFGCPSSPWASAKYVNQVDLCTGQGHRVILQCC